MWKHAGLFGINSSKLPEPKLGQTTTKGEATMPFYLTPKQDDFNQELHICIAEALYDVD